MKQVAIMGATGYTGLELIRLLRLHPEVELGWISSETHQGETLGEVHPHLEEFSSLVFGPTRAEEVPPDTEVVFCALPHGSSAETSRTLLERGIRVVDLSADFRLKEASLYLDWYGSEHPCPDLLKEAVYGLPEANRSQVRKARLVANPGCYPTSVLLALRPLALKGILHEGGLVVDAKSGVSGAGRAPRQAFHFPECSESFKAYRIGAHQHTPEMEQELTQYGNQQVRMLFTPHLIPVNRGIISAAYLPLSEKFEEEELRDIFQQLYREEEFVKVLPAGIYPETRWVRGTNYCHLNWKLDDRTGTLVVVSALDNLVKGAAGQAVQNMNLMLDLPEETGLQGTALLP